MTDDIKLPPLPKPDWPKSTSIYEYTAKQMLEYAREAVRWNATSDRPELVEEIMVDTPYDVFILPLQPSGLLSGPRFVVHVPAQGGGEVVAWAVVGNKSGEILNVFHGTCEKWLADTKYWPEHGFRTRPLVYGDITPR